MQSLPWSGHKCKLTELTCDYDCFHTTAKCVFWILIRNAHFELRSVHMIEVLAYFELRIIHTSDRKCDSPFESVEKRHGCVWVACQSNMHVCCLRFLCMCRARYYRWKWLEGHTSSAPAKHDSEVKSFIHRFCCVICENRNWKTPLYRDLRCAFQITFLRRDLAYTLSFLRSLKFNSKCASQIKIQNTHFAVVWKQSKMDWEVWEM